MDRTAAKSWLTEKFRDLSVYAKFTSGQIDSAYGWAMDMALRQLGIAEASLPTADVVQADVLKYLACMNYYALDRFAVLSTPKYDAKVQKGAADASRSQVFYMIQQLKAQAAEELAQYGIFVGSSQGFQMGRLPLDYLEPSTLSEF